jgi:hypothetical protein
MEVNARGGNTHVHARGNPYYTHPHTHWHLVSSEERRVDITDARSEHPEDIDGKQFVPEWKGRAGGRAGRGVVSCTWAALFGAQLINSMPEYNGFVVVQGSHVHKIELPRKRSWPWYGERLAETTKALGPRDKTFHF